MKLFGLVFSRHGVVALLVSLLLAACTVVVEEDGPRPRPPRPDPQYCTREYQPVCARRGGERQTFANACLADRAGYRVVRPGQCRDVGGDGPTFCTREYAPVCATRRGSVRTFPNACEARAANWRIVDNEPC